VVHPGDCLLPELGQSLGRYAEKKLAKRGVEVKLNSRVTGYDGSEVSLGDGTKIATRNLIWTARHYAVAAHLYAAQRDAKRSRTGKRVYAGS
jgi:NADH dehydrogenase FAD-containing subunit